MKKPTIGVVSRQASTVMITFPGTPCSFAGIRFIDPFQPPDVIEREIAACDSVIVVRDLFQPSYAACMEVIRRQKKPHYYFIDDNFIVLREEFSELAPYTVEAVRQALQSFSGVMLSSEMLMRFYEAEQLHPRLMYFGPVFDAALAAERAANRCDKLVHIGFFGGGFRFKSFYRDVVPVLKLFATENKISLFVRERFEMTDIPGVEVTVVKVTNDFYDFVRLWQSFDLDIVLHSHGASANIDYKTANAALVSYYLGATPILADETVYRHLGKDDGVLLSAPTIEGWRNALSQRIGQMQRSWAYDELDRYCRAAFSPERNVETLRVVAGA